MKIHFEKGKTLPGTRIYHHFVPQSKCKISYKITSDEGILSGSFNLYDKKSLELDLNIIKISKFVTCQYDALWWIGMIQNIDEAGDCYDVIFYRYELGISQDNQRCFLDIVYSSTSLDTQV